jgi:predicted Zn-dependent protease
MRDASRGRIACLLILCLLGVGAAEAARKIKPGFNLFTKEQDVQLGREASQEIEKQVQLVTDPTLTAYVAGLGRRLAAVSSAPEYPYTFKVVADQSINAFALPGGPIYVHTGTLVAAANEAQLAGVLAHEIAHVALRHSTNQASKATLAKFPLAIAGGALGQGGSMLSELARFGVGFGLTSAFLKYSRDAERDADILGARTMANAGLDPVEMARFFEKLKSEGRGGIEFLSDHPSPGNRVKYVQDEVRQMPRRNYSKGSSDFDQIRQRAGQFNAGRSGRR